MKNLIATLFCLTLVSCAINPKNLLIPSAIRSIEVSQPREYIEKHEELTTKIILEKGVYVSIREDANGTYYIGQEKCIKVLLHVPPSSTESSFDCGIWISKSPHQHARLFTVVGSQITNGVAAHQIGHDASNLANQSRYTPIGAFGGAIAGAVIDASMSAELGRWSFVGIKDKNFLDDIPGLVKPNGTIEIQKN